MENERFCELKRMPSLETKRLLLRKMKKDDAPDMFAYASDPDVTRYLLWSPHASLAHTKKYLAYLEKQYRAGRFYDWAVVEKSSGRMIGTCGFASVVPEDLRAEIGYVLNPRWWGRGLASEAVLAVMEFGFFELGLHRIEARFMEGNDRSFAVMKRCGMTFEGMLRDLLFVKGEYRTIGVCARINPDHGEKEGASCCSVSQPTT